MKACEIRIGNLFQGEKFSIARYGIHSDGVTSITGYGIYLLSVNDNILDLKPIPLTEECLLKCGYIKEVINEDGDGLYDHFYNGSIVHLWKFKGKYLFGKGWETELKYVHQLQNLYFALTGEDLQINQ